MNVVCMIFNRQCDFQHTNSVYFHYYDFLFCVRACVFSFHLFGCLFSKHEFFDHFQSITNHMFFLKVYRSGGWIKGKNIRIFSFRLFVIIYLYSRKAFERLQFFFLLKIWTRTWTRLIDSTLKSVYGIIDIGLFMIHSLSLHIRTQTLAHRVRQGK